MMKNHYFKGHGFLLFLLIVGLIGTAVITIDFIDPFLPKRDYKWYYQGTAFWLICTILYTFDKKRDGNNSIQE